jgi:hypothetical protein
MPWGEVEFDGGVLAGVRLALGSGENVLAAGEAGGEPGALPVRLVRLAGPKGGGDGGRALPAPREWHARRDGGAQTRVAAWGGGGPDGFGYTLTWIVDPLGYIRLEVDLDQQETDAGGQEVALVFQFAGRRLDTAYCASYAPPGVWALGAADDAAFAFATQDVPLGKLVTLYRHGVEAVSLVPHQGWIDRLSIRGGAAVEVRYVLRAPAAGQRTSAAFYLLFSPARARRDLKRAVFLMYNPQEVGGPAPFVEFPNYRHHYFPGTTHQNIREWARRGYRYLVFHDNWQTWEANTNAHYGAHRPENEAHLRALMATARACGMKPVYYVGLHNEQYTTAFNRESGERYVAQRRPDQPERWPKQRRVMCLETPYFEHQLSDVDYVLDDLGADGVYFDWMCTIPCFKSHGYHDTPASSIRRMIEMIEYVHARGAEAFIHPGEEGLVPFLFDVADLTVVGERRWSALTWDNLRPIRERLAALAAAGVPAPEITSPAAAHPRLTLSPLVRWTRNTGHVGLIAARWKEDDREAAAAALAAGFNPFAYAEAGSAAAALAGKLARFPLETMAFYTGDELAVTCDPGMGAVGFRDGERLVLLVIGREATKGTVRVPAAALPGGTGTGVTLDVTLARNEVRAFELLP